MNPPLVLSPPIVPEFTDAACVRLCTLMRRWTGVSIEANKAYLIRGRLRDLLQARGIASLAIALDKCETGDSVLQGIIVDAMTTHETLFFRDSHPFQSLVQDLLPRMLAERSASESVNIHCFACSSGQEPYSIAIRLKESFTEPTLARFKIEASDVSRGTIEIARRGEYFEHELRRGLTPAQLQRFFAPVSSSGLPKWRLNDEIRNRVRFDVQNLTQVEKSSVRGCVDVCLCRNVLIYFDETTRQSVLRGLAQMIRPGGWLIVGSSEMVRDQAVHFRPTVVGMTTMYQRTSNK